MVASTTDLFGLAPIIPSVYTNNISVEDHLITNWTLGLMIMHAHISGKALAITSAVFEIAIFQPNLMFV